MVIYLAGLQAIPTDLYEAAEIDGANWYQRIFRITLPMLSPTIFFQLITGVIFTMQIFTETFIMTDGGPANASLFYLLYLYRQALSELQNGLCLGAGLGILHRHLAADRDSLRHGQILGLLRSGIGRGQLMSSTGVGLNARQIISKIIVYLLLAIGSIVILLPLQWMISTSLKPLSHVFRFPPEFLPTKVVWENYPNALTQLPFDLYFGNTVFIVVMCLLGEVIVSSLVAYAFSRLRWRGRNVLFIVVLATMMLPRQVTLIPEFIVFRQLGMIDTFWPLILPSWFGNPFYIFLLRQYFLTHSRELDQAAVIDGCSRFGVFWRITLPMSKPVLGAVAIFSFQFHWNDFFRPLIFLLDQDKYTLALGLRFFSGHLRHRVEFADGCVAGGYATLDHRILLRAAIFHSGRRLYRL